ncbi:hypothetical protein GQ600_26277 [Phytophthora cactorum]|nr:hypothetical protein GQ600_26277 [Phytophthora cactorum]
MLIPPRVHPTETSQGPQVEEASDTCSLFLQSYRTWQRLQVSYYGGKYSMERVFALEAYARTTSISRVLMVCFGTPIPMVILVVLQELIPLQDPSEGWQANYGFWIRIVILAFVVGHTVMGQARFMIDGVVISAMRQILLSGCAVYRSCVDNGSCVYTFLIIGVRLIVGRHILNEMISHSDPLIRFICFVCAQVALACIYLSYETLFRMAEGTRYRMLVILLLPMIKVAVKNMLLRCTAHMEDMVPEAVIFTVDFFNTLYVATCMQSASSVVAVTAITVTDLLQSCVILYGLHRRTAMIRPKLRRLQYSKRRELCFDNGFFLVPRFRSSRKFLNKATKSPPQLGTYFESAELRTHATDSTLKHTKAQSVLKKRSTILIDTSEALFTTECIVVASYLEAIVPLFYCNYMLKWCISRVPSTTWRWLGNRENVGSTVFWCCIWAIAAGVIWASSCGYQAKFWTAGVVPAWIRTGDAGSSNPRQTDALDDNYVLLLGGAFWSYMCGT